MSSFDAGLAIAQRYAESLQVDTCIVERPDPDSIGNDPDSGADTVTYATIYPLAEQTGWCRVKPPAYQTSDAESATSQVTTQRATHEVPAGAPALLPGDLITYAADTATPRLRNVKARVDGIHVGTHTTAQRVPIVILSGVPS